MTDIVTSYMVIAYIVMACREMTHRIEAYGPMGMALQGANP